MHIATTVQDDITTFCKTLGEKGVKYFIINGSPYIGHMPDSSTQWKYGSGIVMGRYNSKFILWLGNDRRIAIGTFNVADDSLTWNIK